jgi:hypothetical protein
MRRILEITALIIATLLPSYPQAGNTWGTDFSDLWWNRNESGWGANVAHQDEVIFMTLFVYGVDQRVRWYVASGMSSQGGADSATFFGPLYETVGPYLGDSIFDPGRVGVRNVGDAILRFHTVTNGTLTYSVDGVFVSKPVERQTFRANDLTGSYTGAELGTATGCTVGSGGFENAASMSVTHAGNAISIVSDLSSTLSCTYAGTYSQAGRMGQILGTMACTNGASGSFTAVEVEASYLAFYARYFVDYGAGCTESGRMGGIKRP